MRNLLSFIWILFFLTFLLILPPFSFADNAPIWEQPQTTLPDPLPAQFTADENGLINGTPVKAVISDPNPAPATLRRIPAPDNLITAPESITASFSISYVANGGTDAYGEPCYTFPESAKTAFNYAANIWANIIKSNVPITIRTCWANLGSSSILGYSGTGSYRRNFQGAEYSNTWYAGSLANALAGWDLDPGIFDMHITYNTNFNWYFGTDANPPNSQHDFVSVVLHEIAHGLNFSGLMDYSSMTGEGSWGYNSGSPSIYDLFIRDGSGKALTDISTYGNPSVGLGNALRSGNIWFQGSEAMAANQGNRVKIYTPSTWQPGSSYSHLDYSTFNNTTNQLMVYAISSGESIHDPGTITKGLLKDLGWTQEITPEPPAVPASISASDGQCLNRVLIEWSASSEATSYTLYRCSSTLTGSCSSLGVMTRTDFHDTAANADKTYYYRVRANGEHGNSGFSAYDIGYKSHSAPNCAAITPSYLLLLQ